MRLSTLLLAIVVMSTAAVAQTTLPEWVPGDCRAAALTSAKSKAADAVLVAVITANVTLPVLGTEVQVSFNLQNGKSEAWIYVYRSAIGDSSILIPVIQIPFLRTCSPLDLPLPSVPIGELGSTPVVASPLEGSALITALQTDERYKTYRSSFPDSLPSIVTLATAVADVPGFPAGTPYWVVFFTGGTAATNMTCFVHATTGLANCLGVDVNSVADNAASLGISVAPNPVRDVAYVTLPEAWTHQRVDIEIVDMLGNTRKTLSTVASIPGLILPIDDLPLGAYTLRLTGNGVSVSVPIIH